MALGVNLTPQFKWKLPPPLSAPTNLSFTLVEFGGGDTPPKADDTQGKQIAFCSGLHDTSAQELDPFHPPPGSILTGEIRSMKGLKPGTWHRWTIRAISSDASNQASFLFRTTPEP
jgi:hypothetical protein